MVGTNVSVKPVFDKRFDYRVHVDVSAVGLMSVFVKIYFSVISQLTKVRKINPVCIFCRHFRKIVEPARTQTSRAERYSVVLIRYRLKQLIVVFFFANNSGQTEHIPRRIVGMYRHIDARFVAGRHNRIQKIHKVFKQFLVRDSLVFVQKFIEFYQ